MSTVDGVMLFLCFAVIDDALAIAMDAPMGGVVATGCRHAAGIFAAYTASGVSDVSIIASACVAVTCWPNAAHGKAPRAAWLMTWAVPLLSLAMGVSQGGGVLPFAFAVVEWGVLMADARADRAVPATKMRVVRELVAEMCIVVWAVGTHGVYTSIAPSC